MNSRSWSVDDNSVYQKKTCSHSLKGHHWVFLVLNPQNSLIFTWCYSRSLIIYWSGDGEMDGGGGDVILVSVVIQLLVPIIGLSFTPLLCPVSWASTLGAHCCVSATQWWYDTLSSSSSHPLHLTSWENSCFRSLC